MATKNTLSSRLKNIITIEQPTDNIDPSGAPVTEWSFFIKRYASIVPLNGTEFFASQQLTVNINVRFRIRYDRKAALITSKHRILWNRRIYDIHTVINQMESNKEIVLMCEENP